MIFQKMDGANFIFIAAVLLLATRAHPSIALRECLQLDNVQLFEQSHVDVKRDEAHDNFTLKWNTKITPGLFYAVVASRMDDYLHSDIIDLSDNSFDGATLKNLLPLVQRILTNDYQCPCGKGKVPIPKTLDCRYHKRFCHDLQVHVRQVGYQNIELNNLLIKLSYLKTLCNSSQMEKAAVENSINYFQLEPDEFGLTVWTDDELENLRNNDYYLPMTFRKVHRPTNTVNLGDLTITMDQDSVTWSNIQERQFTVEIYLLRGRLLEDVKKAEGLNESSYIIIDFDLCSPPEYCPECVEQLLVDIVYESMFGGPLKCPTEEGMFQIPNFIQAMYKVEPSILRCQLSEIMITIRPNGRPRKAPSYEFQQFSLNLESVPTPCLKDVRCFSRDCSNDIV